MKCELITETTGFKVQGVVSAVEQSSPVLNYSSFMVKAGPRTSRMKITLEDGEFFWMPMPNECLELLGKQITVTIKI